MMSCISSKNLEDLSIHSGSVVLCERDRLQARMLSSRTSVRVICAPAFYGKSILAYQYVISVFAQSDICWIDADKPAFLIALDRGVSAEFSENYLDKGSNSYHQCAFIFDGCPKLDEHRFACLIELFDRLLRAGQEVIVTTRDTSWLEERRTNFVTLDARDLLLDDTERERLYTHNHMNRDNLSIHRPYEHAGIDSIVGLSVREMRVEEANCTLLSEIDCVDESAALSLLAAIIGDATVQELSVFAGKLSAQTLLNIERRYPHAGITRFEPIFSAPPLKDADRFLLVCKHLSTLVRMLSPFDSEQELIKVLCDILLKHGKLDLATRLVCSLQDERARLLFYDKHAAHFIFTGKPLLLLYLASTLSSGLLNSKGRWFDFILAHVLVGETRHASILARQLRDNRETKSEVFQIRDCEQNTPAPSLTSQQRDLLFPRALLESEMFLTLLVVLLDPHESIDLKAMANCARRERKRLESEMDISSPKKLDPTLSLLHLIEETFTSSDRGVRSLLRFAASGYAIKDILIANCFYLCLRKIQVVSRSSGDSRGCLRDHRAKKAHIDQAYTSSEDVLDDALVDHLLHLLARQSEVLEVNVCERFLLDRYRKSVGERGYLFVSDELLNRFDQISQRLEHDQAAWKRVSKNNGAAAHASKEEDSLDLSHENKKLRINTFGRFEIESYDPSITVKSKVRKQLRMLISLMAINQGREVARPWIQRVMWPNATERNARQSLYTMWSLLNKSIVNEKGECPFFESHPQSLSINDRLVETDTQLLNDVCRKLREGLSSVSDYERAIELIEDIYRGPLLPGDETTEVAVQRKRYQERLLEVLLKSGSLLRKRGEAALALRYLNFAFEIDQTRGDICYELMMVLWKLGRHGDALNEYFVCRDALVENFGIEGNAKLRSLYDDILQDAS